MKLRVCCKLNVLRTNEADVAQLVEQPIRNRQVTSSSLVVGSSPPVSPAPTLVNRSPSIQSAERIVEGWPASSREIARPARGSVRAR